MSMKEYWLIYYTLLRKEVVRILRIWPQTLLPPVITMTLYFLVFGKVIGNRIGVVHSLSYIEYITPGLIIMTVINNSYTNVVGSFFGARFNRSIEELLVSPMNNHTIILGYVSGGVSRGLVVGMLVSIVSLFCGGLTHIYSVGLVVLSVIFCGTLFSLGGLLNGIFSRNFDDTMIFSTFILTPLIYLGGVFYRINFLPYFWQKVSIFNPLFYIIDFSRYAFLGETSVKPLWSFLVIVILTVCMYFTTWSLLARGTSLKS